MFQNLRIFLMIVFAVPLVALAEPKLNETADEKNSRELREAVLAFKASEAQQKAAGVRYVDYGAQIKAELTRLTGRETSRLYTEAEAAVLARDHFKHIPNLERAMASDSGLRREFAKKLAYYLEQESPFRVKQKGAPTLPLSPNEYEAWRQRKFRELRSGIQERTGEMLRLASSLGFSYTLKTEEGKSFQLNAEVLKEIRLEVSVQKIDKDSQAVECELVSYRGKPIRTDKYGVSPNLSDMQYEILRFLEKKGGKGMPPDALEKWSRLSAISHSLEIAIGAYGQLTTLKTLEQASRHKFEANDGHFYEIHLSMAYVDSVMGRTPPTHEASPLSTQQNWDEFGNISPRAGLVFSSELGNRPKPGMVYLRLPTRKQDGVPVKVPAKGFQPGQNRLSLMAYAPNAEGGYFAVVVPEGEVLTGLRVVGKDGEALVAGKHFDLIEGALPGDLFLHVKGDRADQGLAYQVSSQAAPKSSPVTDAAGDLRLERKPLEAIRSALEEAGLTAIADALEGELEKSDSLSVEKLRKLISENSLYSYAAPRRRTSPPDSKNRYERHAHFTNNDGELTMQCKQAAVLMNDILTHYQEIAGKFPGVQFHLRSGYLTRSDEVRVATNDAHAWLEAVDAKGGLTIFDPTPKLLDPKSPKPKIRSSADLGYSIWDEYLDSRQRREKFWHAFEPKVRAHADAIGEVSGKLNHLIGSAEHLKAHTGGELLLVSFGLTRALQALLDRDVKRAREIVRAQFPSVESADLATPHATMKYVRMQLDRMQRLLGTHEIKFPPGVNGAAVQLHVAHALDEADQVIKLFSEGETYVTDSDPVRPLKSHRLCNWLFPKIAAIR